MQIYSWMDTLVAQHPNLVTKEEIGRSYENRPMYVLKVGSEYLIYVCVCVTSLLEKQMQLGTDATTHSVPASLNTKLKPNYCVSHAC